MRPHWNNRVWQLYLVGFGAVVLLVAIFFD
jgi:hypothetical protein